MGKKTVRIITRIDTDRGASYDLGEVIRDQLIDGGEESREIVEMFFLRDGLVAINTSHGFRDRSGYVLKMASRDDDKDITYGLVPYSKVALVTFKEETLEEDKSCETPTTELKRVEDQK